MTATAPVTSGQNLAGRAHCPRCGYDLRGAIGTWADQCPLHGTCAECGLQFVWAEVLHPEKFSPLWCVEFVRQRRKFGRACCATFIRSFRPSCFWSALKMLLPIRWRRIALYIFSLLLPLLLCYVSIQSIAAVRVRSVVLRQVQQYQADTLQKLARTQANISPRRIRYRQQYFDRKQRLKSLQQETMSQEQPTNAGQSARETAQQSNLRNFVESVETEGLEAWIARMVQRDLQILQPSAQIPVTISHSYLAAALEAVCFPWRTTSSGTITYGFSPAPYPAPAELHSTFRSNFIGRSSSSSDKYAFVKTLASLGLALWVWLLFPLTFILLPVSKRRAKVRWAHLFRITAYAAFIPSAAITAVLAIVSLGYAFDKLQAAAFGWGHLISRYAMIPMLTIWWAAAMKRYLHIPHSWAVAVLLTSMLCLVLLAGLWVAFPDFLLAVY
ncbi:MAG: hypothetical protein V3T84_15340 [Phycisphaerales bacterium]